MASPPTVKAMPGFEPSLISSSYMMPRAACKLLPLQQLVNCALRDGKPLASCASTYSLAAKAPPRHGDGGLESGLRAPRERRRETGCRNARIESSESAAFKRAADTQRTCLGRSSEPALGSALRLRKEPVGAVGSELLAASRLKLDQRSSPRTAAKSSAAKEVVGPGDQLKQGMLLEFRRDNGKLSLGILQKPDGKRNWIVEDQHGNSFSIRPQQISFVVPTSEAFTVNDLPLFSADVEACQDPSLLELAWEEQVGPVGVEDLAELLYSIREPVQIYATHRMLSEDRLFYRRKKHSTHLFECRPLSQVDENRQKLQQEESAKAVVDGFVSSVRAVLLKPRNENLQAGHWAADPVLGPRIAAIKSFALEIEADDRLLAEESLEVLGVPRVASAALDLIMRLGVLPRHVNIELLKSDIPIEFEPSVAAAASRVFQEALPDLDEDQRLDLLHLKVYMIDSEDTVEVDDGISMEVTESGQRKVWIHVADPTRWLRPNDVLDKEARRRCTSIYLPGGVVPMFPLELAAGPMSLRQGEICCAMSVGCTLNGDGSLADVHVTPSLIRPTYRLEYNDVEDMLAAAPDEEQDLILLRQVAELRNEYRLSLGAVEINMPESEVKVSDQSADEPAIHVEVIDQSQPARRLVSELMILCGEAVARFGYENGLPLPYRGQSAPFLPAEDEMEGIPPGPCTAAILRRCMTRSETNCQAPLVHSSLALTGYVQFSSPIRRYGDLLAHFQVKAALRGDPLPFSVQELENMVALTGVRRREVQRHETASIRYWLLEHLRRQGKGATTPALVLRWLRMGDTLVAVLLLEYGYETVMRMTRDIKLGDILTVAIVEVNPRKEVLRLQEVSLQQAVASSLAKAAVLLHMAKPSPNLAVPELATSVAELSPQESDKPSGVPEISAVEVDGDPEEATADALLMSPP